MPTFKADVLHKVLCLFWVFSLVFALDWGLPLQQLPAKRFSCCKFKKKTKTGLRAKPAAFLVFIYDSLWIMLKNPVIDLVNMTMLT